MRFSDSDPLEKEALAMLISLLVSEEHLQITDDGRFVLSEAFSEIAMRAFRESPKLSKTRADAI